MTAPRLSVIVAVAKDGVIGDKGALPWRIPDDLAWFRRQTMGKPMIMGRKTFQSLGKPLPGRPHIVLTGNRDFSAPPGVFIAHALDDALEIAAGLTDSSNEIMAIGGAMLYARILPLADRLYLTAIDADFAGDAHFPSFDEGEWEIAFAEAHDGPPPFSFSIRDRRRASGGGSLNSL